MAYWNMRACKPTLRCRGRHPCIPPWSALPPAPGGVGDYEQVTRGKHLFGGVYETFVNGEPIGPVYQGPGSPWWQPAERGGLGDMADWGFGFFFGAVAGFALGGFIVAQRAER